MSTAVDGAKTEDGGEQETLVAVPKEDVSRETGARENTKAGVHALRMGPRKCWQEPKPEPCVAVKSGSSCSLKGRQVGAEDQSRYLESMVTAGTA